jgi:flagellar motor switch protein FliG
MAGAAARGRNEPLRGAQKGAVLCLALGPAGAARAFQHLEPAEVERLSREVAALPSVGADVLETVLDEYREAVRADAGLAHGGVRAAHQMLEQALGASRARQVLERVVAPGEEAGVQRLRRADAETLSTLVRGEHPQTIALLLTRLDGKQAARLLGALDPALAADVVYRLASMSPIAPEALALVESAFAGRPELSLGEGGATAGGPATAADLLNLAAPEIERGLIGALGERDADLAARVQGLMFVFEDLLLLDNKAVQRLLREIETRDLATGLKAASAELKALIRANMSERAAAALEEEMEILGAVRVKDVEAAQARIIERVRALEQAGEIAIRGRGDDDDVVA